MPYALEYHGSWRIDVDSITRARDRSRARDPRRVAEQPDGIVPASRTISRRCRRSAPPNAAGRSSATKCSPTIRSIRRPRRRSVLAGADVLTFSLGGLSKSAGLPQVKLGWIGFGGPAPNGRRGAGGLRDHRRHLSVGVDAGAGGGADADRARRRHSRADPGAGSPQPASRCASSPRAHPVGRRAAASKAAGRRSCRCRSFDPKRRWCSSCSTKDDVLVHPGYFFDFAREAFIVVSLLVEPALFDRGDRAAC